MHDTLLTNAKFAVLGAVDLRKESWETFSCKLDENLWRTNDPFLDDVSTVFEFFDSKTIFIAQQLKNPIRKSSVGTFPALIKFSKNSLNVEVGICVSYFEEQELLQILIYFDLNEVSGDELIFMKELKWYHLPDPDEDGIFYEDHKISNYYHLASKILPQGDISFRPSDTLVMYDFIELRTSSKSEGPENTIDSRLYHGLLYGDEGFRFVRPTMIESLGGNNPHTFCERSYFHYHFAPTSCLAILDNEVHQTKDRWADKYLEEVGHIAVLNAYIRLDAKLACFSEGTLLNIEICLLRYAELCRIKQRLDREGNLKSSELVQISDKLDDMRLHEQLTVFFLDSKIAEITYQNDQLSSSIERILDRRIETAKLRENRRLRRRLTAATVIIAIVAAFLRFVEPNMSTWCGQLFNFFESLF